MRRPPILAWLFVGALLTFLFAPVVCVVLFSFNDSAAAGPPIKGLTLSWYREIFTNVEYTDALRNSLQVALISASCSVVAGTAAALALVRLPRRITAVLAGFFVVPMVVPALFIGVALLSFFTRIGFELSLQAVIVGHIIVTLPLVIALIGARLQNLDLSMLEAARDLGASGPQAFARVLLPLIAPAIVSAALLSIATSADEFIISLFVNGGDQTVPVVIFGGLRTGVTPAINALASTILAATVLATLIAGRLVSLRDVAR
ncbi:ABC transporter permease [Conexibacter sp. JD483]|uniref:ABC transporter permease n=1 Tax=unclassified Conexibacter TaxID=2627773 RepID=UPI00271A002A|nr:MULTISPECIES: ABC transporter permease [unclassified Conexibacter]MDO8187355.1 ABC transporter permease [Conexibacter sp. CPCC 205706]MDO8200512.1 ABC transporter permease [Conexibacter sp. CPCC 205762]MDR9371766.1 ABC transporter permease [Conexibacter sp. JD483]